MIKCIECGSEFDESLGTCPECGCPITAYSENNIERNNKDIKLVGKERKSKKGLIGIICGVIIAALVVVGVIVFLNSSKAKTVVLNGDVAELKVGDDLDLTYTVTPEKAKIKTVSWRSSDTEVASVQDGHVNAHKSGECIISVEINSKIKAEYSITVIDLAEKQQEALSKLVSFVEDNSDYAADGVSMVTVGAIDSETDFFIGCKGKDLYLVIEKEPIENTKQLSCNYNTYVVIKSGDIEKASFKQYNTIDILGYKANSTGDGEITFNEYKLGNKVVIDSFKSSMDNTKGIETGVTDDFQKLADNGVKNGFDQLKKFLEENDDIGCTIEDLQITSIYE